MAASERGEKGGPTGAVRGGLEALNGVEEGKTRERSALKTLSMFSKVQTTLLRISATSEDADCHSGMVWQIEESMRSPMALTSSRILLSRSTSLCFWVGKQNVSIRPWSREIGRR